MTKPKILTHVCCAPDALYVAGLLQEAYDPALFFYNPNIQPRQEYERRIAEARSVAGRLKLRLIEGIYDQERWAAVTRKFKDEPEKGKRCDVCYALRLQKTAEACLQEGYGLFTTVMSLSPWKKAESLNRIGRLFAARYRIKFLEANFKKKDGFRKSVELSRAHGLYRQDYCGCVFSKKARDLKNDEDARP